MWIRWLYTVVGLVRGRAHTSKSLNVIPHYRSLNLIIYLFSVVACVFFFWYWLILFASRDFFFHSYLYHSCASCFFIQLFLIWFCELIEFKKKVCFDCSYYCSVIIIISILYSKLPLHIYTSFHSIYNTQTHISFVLIVQNRIK